jgi:dephospho-CoA kinase
MVLAIMLVAITGGIGSGKTYITKVFEQLNIPVIYADQVAKELIANNKNIRDQVTQYFNTLDLKQISTQIFKSQKKRLFLEKLIHQRALEKISKQAMGFKTSNNYCVIEIPLLHNILNILDALKVDQLILIDCDRNIQISRVMHRNRLSKFQVMSIIKSQLSSSFAIKKIHNLADYVLNGDDLKQLHIQVITLCSLLNKKLNSTLKNTVIYRRGIS